MELKSWLLICVGLVEVLQTAQRSTDIPGLIEVKIWSSNNVTRRQFPGFRDAPDWSIQGSTVDEPESTEESNDKIRESKAVSTSTTAPTIERTTKNIKKRKTKKTKPKTTTKQIKSGRTKKKKLRKQTTESTAIKIHTSPITKYHKRKRSQPTTEKPRIRKSNPKKSRKMQCDGNCCKKI